jgi:hypothetical protein
MPHTAGTPLAARQPGSFAEALLGDAGIACMVLDQNMSVIEGSLGVLPRRLLVDSDRLDEARTLLTDAGLQKDLR